MSAVIENIDSPRSASLIIVPIHECPAFRPLDLSDYCERQNRQLWGKLFKSLHVQRHRLNAATASA